MTQLHKALAHLHRQIAAGGEFPDAAHNSAVVFGAKQSELEKLYDDGVEYDVTCPMCGGHDFSMQVLQEIKVAFGHDCGHEVYDGPDGDLEFDDDTYATCVDCGHSGKLGDMK